MNNNVGSAIKPMNRNELANCLLNSLLELEKAGDVIVTHPNLSVLAEQICDSLVQKWAAEFLEAPPYEVVIDSGLNAASEYLQCHFNLNALDAHIVARQFLDSLGTSRTKTELAELISHQGYREIAYGAYFCIHLKLGEYYDADYLEWRRREYAKRHAQ